MSNILPIDFILSPSSKPYSGYRRTECPQLHLKGYEFHYSNIVKDDTPKTNTMELIYNLKGTESIMPFYKYKNVIASYTHWYWGDKNILKLWE